MSVAAVITTVRDKLRATGGSAVFDWQNDFKINPTTATIAQTIGEEVSPGNPPPTWGGQRFLGIWGSSWADGRTNNEQQLLAERIGITCTLTFRWMAMTEDDIPAQLYIHTNGMLAIARKIMRAVHDNNTLLAAVNTAAGLTSPSTNCFIEWLKWESTDAAPEMKGPDWFGERLDAPEDSAHSFGLAMNIRFGGALRTECLQGVTQ